MSLLINPATTRVADALSRVGLGRVNRLGKRIVWTLGRDHPTVMVDGLRVSGPAESWSVLGQLAAGRFERFEAAQFAESIRPGMTVLDIGANIGYYTLLAARGVGPSGRVYAFEPDARSRSGLERNLRLNQMGNVTVIPKAVSDTAGRQPLYLSDSAAKSGLSRSMAEDSVVDTTIVDTVRIDDLLEGARVDVVKMDIEGHEPAALRGMRETLERSPDLRLFLEFSPVALRAAGTDAASFGAALRSDFDDVRLIDERSECLRPFSQSTEEGLCNLLCRGVRVGTD
jgi:FkbM family methyltransferase